MDFVHVGRNEQQSQPSVKAIAHTHVRMFQQRIQTRKTQVQGNDPKRQPENSSPQALPKCSPQRLARMLPESSRDIDFQLGMMYAMKPPAQRHFVQQEMREVREQI